jgi:hypothetical protein
MAKIIWDESERDVNSINELDLVLDELHAEFSRGEPVLVVLELSETGDSLAIGLGRDESVLSYVPGDKNPPYFTSTSEKDIGGTLVFRFMGDCSEFPLRNTVPIKATREAVRYFWRTGRLTTELKWEED